MKSVPTPRNRILIPLDGSSLAEAMVRRLRPLLRATGAEVSLLTVARTAAGITDARRHLAASQYALEKQGIRVRVHVRRGEPASQILAAATREEAWCIAMATHGRSGTARWALGSVAERVLRESAHPVLIANPAALRRDLAPTRIIVPLDGSDVSAGVLPQARAFATAFGARLALVHFTEPGNGRSVREVPPKRSVGAFLNARVEECEAAGVGADLRVTSGPVAERLLEFARGDGADLIAMTTHGRSGFDRWVYGSIAETVVRHAACPMLIHRPARAVVRASAGGAAPAGVGSRWVGVASV